MGKTDIEEKLNQVLKFLKDYIAENNYPPSVREICKELSIKSTASAYYYLEQLQKQGLIIKAPSKKRAIGLSNQSKAGTINVPYIGKVTAGTPILAVENFEEFLPVPSAMFSNSDEHFILCVQGDSMIEVGIFNNDKIIVKKQSNAENGDIIVALIDDTSTVKRFFKKQNKIILHPENKTMQDLILDEVEILGKVVGLIRKF